MQGGSIVAVCLRPVIRALHVLSVLFFLCLQAGSLIPPVPSVSGQTSGCSTPEPGCDDNAQCWCCATPTVRLTPVMTAEPTDTPLARTAILAFVSPPQPPPVDILHVPKSV